MKKLPINLVYSYRSWKLNKCMILTGENGVCSVEDGEIQIAKGQSHDDEVNTTMHELIHLIVRVNGLPITKREEEEEQLVTVVANSLCELASRNPGLVEYLYSHYAKKCKGD